LLFFFCSHGSKQKADGYALGLPVNLRDLCQKIGNGHYSMAAELHDLLRKVAHPNVGDVDKELQFKVEQRAAGEDGEILRTISLNGNVEVGRAEFDAAVKCYPKEKWVLAVEQLRRRQVRP
jgi:hypothetical protein